MHEFLLACISECRMLPLVKWLIPLMLTVSFCHAEIVWETNTIERSVRAGEPDAKVEFTGKNTGSEPVEILQVISSCSCLAAEVSSRTVEPGKTVTVTGVFSLDDRTGFQRKTIELRTEPPTTHRQVLTLRMNILQDVYLDQRHLYWSPDRPATSLRVRIKVLREQPLYLVGLESGDKRLRAQAFEVENGREYRVEVTPSDVSELFESAILFQFRDDEGESFRVTLPAAVR